MSHETPDLLKLVCPYLHHMWSWLSPIEWQRKAWLIHISGKNFLTESELCDLALSPTEDTLPFVSPGPILPRSQTLHKCPTEPPLCTCRANVPTWLQSQLLFATTNFYFGSALTQKTGLCPTEFPPFPTIMPWCSQLYCKMTSFFVSTNFFLWRCIATESYDSCLLQELHHIASRWQTAYLSQQQVFSCPFTHWPLLIFCIQLSF